jgi:DNA-binding IclR family transcriptional regulator
MSSLQNAIRILGLLDQSAAQLRVSEAARSLDLPKSTVSRLVKEMTGNGLLEPDPAGGFRSGPELFRLGSLYRVRLPAEARIDEALGELVQRHRATAYVGVLRGMELLVLRRHESSFPVRFIQEPGTSIPAFSTAVGKALLARLPDEEISAALPQRLSADGRGTQTTRVALLRELAAVRERGWAELDDRLLGVGAIGVSVLVAPGRALGFALCFGRETDETQRAEIAAELCALATRIGALCNDPYWDR